MADILVEDLYKEFDVGGGVEVAVNGIDIGIDDGEFVTFVGPSGCGKTTTLRCIAGLESPTSGRILIDGENVTHKPPQRRNLSMVFQDIALYPHMTARENIEYPLRLADTPEGEINERVEEATKILQINELLDKKPSGLSGGQAQRVAIARAIVRDPAAFLLDEPMSDLDAKLKMEMRKEVGKIHKELDATMVYVTHDQEEAMTLSDRMAVMNDGRIEQSGTPQEVYRNPVNTFVAEFIGSPSINFLDFSLESVSDGQLTVNGPNGESITFEYDLERSVPIDTLPKEFLLGFRPRHVRLDTQRNRGIEASVILNEPIGDEVIQYLNGPEGEIRAVTSVEGSVNEEQDVSIQIQTSGIYLFDKESGERLVRGKQSADYVQISV